MDSSHYNPTYGSYSSHHLTPGHLLPPPPPLPPPPSHILQSHPESPNFCGRSNQSGFHRPNYYVFSDRHDFQPEVAVSSQPSSYYSQHPSTLQQLHLPYIPEKVGYDSPMASQPSFFPSAESEDITRSVWVGYKERGPDSWTMDAGRGRVETDCRDIAQPVWVGYNENRPEPWTVDGGPDRMDVARGRVDAGPNRIDDVRGQVDVGPGRNYQFDYDRSSRVCSGFSSNCGLDNTSRSRDEFESIGCVRKESGAARIEGNYEDRGHLRLESDRYIRGLGEGIRGFSSSAGYGNERYGGTANLDMTRSPTTHDGAGNQRWVEAPTRGRAPFSRKRHDCHHSEVDRYFDNVRREHSSELDRMPKKQIQKKSVLLRLEVPRVKPNGRENRSRHPSQYSGKRVSSSVAVTPRSSKARREMVTNKTERDSVTEGNGKFVTHASYEASASEGSRQFTRKSTVSKIEKKPDSHLSPSSSPNGVKLNKVKVVDGFGQDCKLKITDAGPEALTCVSEAKVCSTIHAADKISRFCEASKEPNDDSNMKLCSTREDTTDGCKSKLKSYEDVLENKGTDTLMGEALMGKVTEIDEILNMKTKVNTSLVTSPVSWPKSADIKPLSVCSEGGIPLAATSMCSGGSQPCEEKDMDGIPSKNLQMMEVNVGLQETNSISSSIRTLSYGEKDLVDKSSLDATIFSISEDTGDHVLAKSSMSDVGDDVKDENKGNNKYADSLSYEIDPSSGIPKGLVSSASLDGVSFSKDLANATNSVSGDLANANSYTGEACTTTRVNTPDRSVVFQVESKVFSHSQVNGNTVNPLVDNASIKEFMETAPFNYSAETDEILDIEEEAYVNSISSSPTKFTGKGSSNALDEDLGLSSHHSAFVDQFSDSDNRGLKSCFSEANASLCKYITDDTNESTICDKFPRSSGFVIETNLAIGNSETSCSERVIDTESGFLETQPSSGECKFVSQDRFVFGSSGEVGSVWNPSMGNNPENHLRTGSCLVPDSSAGTCHISPTVPVSEQIQNTTSNKASCCDSQGDIMPKENNSAENIEVGSQEEKMNPADLTSKFSLGPDIVAVNGDSVLPCNSLPSSPRLSFGQIRSETLDAVVVNKPNKDKESDDEDALLDPLEEQMMTPHEVTQQGQTSTNTDIDSCGHPMPIDSGGDLVEKCNADPIEKVTDVTSDVGSHVKYSPNSVKTDMRDGEVLTSDGKIYGSEVPRDSGVHVSRLHSHTDVKSSLGNVKDLVVSVPSRESQSKTSLKFRCEMQKGKKKSGYATQKCYPRSLPSASDSKKGGNPPTNITNRLTWHRKSATSASPLVAVKPLSATLSTQQKFPKVTTQSSSSSYVRKGNSLVRKPSHSSPGISSEMPPSSIKLNRITVEDKSMGSVGRIGVDNTIFVVKAGERLTQQSRSASGSSSKISNVVASSSGKCALSSSNDHLTTGLPESIMDSASSGEAIVPHSGGDAIKTSDTLHHTGYVSDCQQKKNPPKLDSSTFRKMVYVKKKANQLVAASDIHGACKSQIPPTDGYYKRSVNQLVRNSESHVDQAISSRDDSSDSQTAAKMISERSSISAFCNSAVVRPFKQSKFSRVWKQSDPQSGIPIVHMRYQKILPQLVPWKRVTYWRRLMNSVSNVRSGSFSNISRKLLMMRKRHTVYTRSSNGYSLRKSKVLSIGGSHLKWSKSIERDSRKANEEATLAVAAFAKKTSEKHRGQSNTGTNRNHLARERIFRIGSLRYKMDSSRRTLQRISDVGSPCSGPSENGKGAKKPFIPKRLVIGNEEYVRVGNGNQLVRDPKKRTRVLANEKVRWSLHNVRLRLAKKKKYCQFFTRFGKCNKDDGKCPYIHDPSKIAVCTKFLNGLCVNANCKLTHKVIPERMPDCSYFLQGLCNNGACPYRHVHVNPNAAICDEFLKGYCSDGDECRKKHTYTCPVFEATGSCPKGSKCKLHHPKKQTKGKKRKRASEPSQKNARGRYFGSLHKDLSESEPMVLDRRAIDNEVFGIQGLEFIKLDSTEYQASSETDDQTATEQLISSDGEVSIEDLIRPVLLMQQEVL